jgi:hypothetical protein
MKVMTKDLVKKTPYYLNYDYWPKGGTKVFVKRKIPASNIWKGQRGEAVEVKDEEGNIYFINPRAWLFAQIPITKET